MFEPVCELLSEGRVKFLCAKLRVSVSVLLLTICLASGKDVLAQVQWVAPDAAQVTERDASVGITTALPMSDWSSETVQEDWSDMAVTITIHDAFSPYASSSYEWKARGQSPMVVLTRVHVAGWGRNSELGLVAVAEYQTMLGQIAQCLSTVPMMAYGSLDEATGVSVSVRHGAQRYESDFETPTFNGSCLDALLHLVEERVTLPPYRMPFWNEGEWGALQTGSDLPARVYVDGWDTGETTPLTGLRLEPGVHRVVWRSLQGELDKELDVTVERGRTTTVNVVLE